MGFMFAVCDGDRLLSIGFSVGRTWCACNVYSWRMAEVGLGWYGVSSHWFGRNPERVSA